jgi:crotonobetainyl-CoA:carnitine CoA-transferase CaiB-like acyl-CoA transferase
MNTPPASDSASDHSSEAAPGPLDGLRVLDLGLLVQGPQAALLLGDMGADVVKVELPGFGDQSRWIPVSPQDLRAPYFIACNRGKRSITIDLRRERGREVFLRLADTADVIVSNFVPGTLERWKIDYETVSARNPRIIFGSGSTFGPSGADATRKGADIAGQASGGLIHRTGRDADSMTPIGVTIADHIGSQNLANGILAALLARERTGRGQKVEVSLLGGQIYAQASEYTYAFLTGRNPGRAERGHPLIPMLYGVFPTADGQIAIVGVTPPFRSAFFAALGRPELVDEPRFATPILAPDSRRELFDILAERFRTRTTAEWERILAESGQRYAAVRDYLEVARDESPYANGYLQRIEHPEWGAISMIGSPIRLSATPIRPKAFAPELGQHTEEILLELDYDWDEIAALRDAKAI